MLTKINLKNIALLFLALTLAACAQAARAEQQANAPAPSAMSGQLDNTSAPAVPVIPAVVAQAEAADEPVAIQAEATSKIEAICFRYSEETQLLINPVLGYCVQYPIGYDIALLNGMGIMVVKHTPMNAEDPNLFINVEPANGRNVEQVADQLVTDYSVPGLEVKRTLLEIDQEHAIVLDGLTGQDPNRHVVVLHNDLLYHMTFALMENSPEVRAQAEALFNTVVQSFSFRPETNLCTDCPPQTP